MRSVVSINECALTMIAALTLWMHYISQQTSISQNDQWWQMQDVKDTFKVQNKTMDCTENEYKKLSLKWFQILHCNYAYRSSHKLNFSVIAKKTIYTSLKRLQMFFLTMAAKGQIFIHQPEADSTNGMHNWAESAVLRKAWHKFLKT